MFGTHFYHQLTRKMVVIFGNLFNNIELVKTNSTNSTEIERIKVPIKYGQKEKYVVRLEEDPTLNRETQITLPVMSFEITSISYDESRKLNTLHKSARANTSTAYATQYMGVPYNIGFDLNIYARNIEDANQIVEQILPYFTPSYTVTVSVIPELSFTKDIPIVLNSVNSTVQHEGNYDTVRYVNWTLSFTMKTHYFGPVQSSKIIRKVITNIYNDPSLALGYVVRINTGAGSGNYRLDDVVYQGNNYTTASAYGIVTSWSNAASKLVLGGVQGTFKLNHTIKGLSTNATHTIESFELAPIKLAKIVIEPDPINAEPDDDFGYTTTITEYPNIVE